MRSTKIQSGRGGFTQEYNSLRADAEGATWLLPHQQTGFYSLGTNPTNGQTATFVINGTSVVATFVSSIGSAANNVLIGASAAATVLNLFNWLRSPNVTSSTQVAAIAANCQLLSYVEWKQVGTVITACSLNNDTYAPLTSYSGSTTATSGTYTAQTMQLFVEKGQYLLLGSRVAFAGGSSPTITAPVGNPRIDLLTIDSTGTLALVTGTPGASPAVPAYPANKITLCEIYNPTGETSITDNANQLSGQGYIQYDVRSYLQNTDTKISQAATQITGTDTGSANAYAIAPVPAITAYTTGMMFSFIVAHANTGASTLAVSGLSATTIKKYGTQALIAGDMVLGMSAALQYDGANFQILNPATAPIPPQGVAFPGASYDGAQTSLNFFTQLGAGVNGITGQVDISAVNSTSSIQNLSGTTGSQSLVLDTVSNTPVPGGNLWTPGANSLPATTVMRSPVLYSGANTSYTFGNNGGSYTGSYYPSNVFSSAVTFAGSPPAPTNGVPPAAFTDGTFIYVAQTAGVYSKFSVSGATLTYVSTVTYTGMSSGCVPWSDGTSVFGYTSSGIAKWALAGGSATQYSGTTIVTAGNSFQMYVVGVSQVSPWLAVILIYSVQAFSGGVGYAIINTAVTFIPKF
jgi:hypothetical protein